MIFSAGYITIFSYQWCSAVRASHARAPLLGKPIGLTPVTYFPSEKFYPPFEQLVEAEGEGNEIDKVEQSVLS